MKNLVSMVAFIKEQKEFLKNCKIGEEPKSFGRVINYADFLSLMLEIWQFVPCKLVDGVWVVLEKPDLCNYHIDEEGSRLYNLRLLEWKQAKERCLFEGFEYKKELKNSGGNYTHFLENKDIRIYIQWGGFYLFGKYDLKTIEDLVKYNLELTQTAQKLIGL